MPVAELINILKNFAGPDAETPVTVLEKLFLTIESGHSIAITGPSGSGKTTLLRILGTLDQPTSGTVMMDGQDISQQNSTRLAWLRNRYIGFVFQQHHLLPQLTVIENVLLPVLPVDDKDLRKSSEERATRLLEAVGLKNYHHRYPVMMSVGECQRVAVVRALINQPSLLLADEPTGSLDARNAMILSDLLVKLQAEQGFAMVVVTHDPAVAAKMKIQKRLFNGRLE